MSSGKRSSDVSPVMFQREINHELTSSPALKDGENVNSTGLNENIEHFTALGEFKQTEWIVWCKKQPELEIELNIKSQ